MSVASCSRTIKFISKAGTYTAVIMSPSGDLYQDYEGTSSDVTAIYPNFGTMQPVLYFVCTSSRVAEGVADPDGMEYYFNGQKSSLAAVFLPEYLPATLSRWHQVATSCIMACKSLKILCSWQASRQPLLRWWLPFPTARRATKYKPAILYLSSRLRAAATVLLSWRAIPRTLL